MSPLIAQHASPEGKKPSLVVIGEGGAISSRREGDEILPCKEALAFLIQNVPEALIGLFHRIRPSTAFEQPMVLSSDATTERIEGFANKLRKIAHGTKQNVLALIGAHAAPKYAAAVAEALCADDMNIRCKGSDQISGQRSVLLACARNTPYEYPSDAQNTVNDAVMLSAMPEMRGRAGLLFHGKVFALPGLQRKGEPIEFDSRFPTIAHRDEQSEDWYFSETSPAHFPHGECGEKFLLDSGIQRFDIRGDEQESILAAIHASASKGKLSGMVLQTAARSGGHLREDNVDILSQLDTLEIPGIVVCDTLHKAGNGTHANGQKFEYRHLFDGRGLLSEEVQILLARWVAQAKSVGINDKEALVDFVRQKLSAHSGT